MSRLSLNSFETQFIFDDASENIVTLLDDNEGINWFKENIETVNTELLLSVLTNLVPFKDDGRKYFMRLINHLSEDDKEKVKLLFDKVAGSKITPKSYNEMFKQGYTGDNTGNSI